MVRAAPDAYDRIARFYAKVIDPINAPLRSAALKLSAPIEGRTVLDVGCGTGGLVGAYLDAGAIASGIDLSHAMLAVAADRLDGRADLRKADATALPFADDTFEVVTASLFLHELPSQVRHAVVTEMARVVRPGGHLLIVDFRVGSLRMKGRLLRAFSVVAERLAGREHHRNWKSFMRSGGMATVFTELGLVIENEKITAGGNMGLWLVSVPSKAPLA